VRAKIQYDSSMRYMKHVPITGPIIIINKRHSRIIYFDISDGTTLQVSPQLAYMNNYERRGHIFRRRNHLRLLEKRGATSANFFSRQLKYFDARKQAAGTRQAGFHKLSQSRHARTSRGPSSQARRRRARRLGCHAAGGMR